MITVALKIEGVREKEPVVFTVHQGITIAELMQVIAEENCDELQKIKDYLFNQRTGELGFYMVLVNNTMVHRSKFATFKLCDGDEITVIMPIGGG